MKQAEGPSAAPPDHTRPAERRAPSAETRRSRGADDDRPPDAGDHPRSPPDPRRRDEHPAKQYPIALVNVPSSRVPASTIAAGAATSASRCICDRERH